MYVKKNCGYVLTDKELLQLVKGRLDTFDPETVPGTKWKQWISEKDLKTCPECQEMQGKIYPLSEIVHNIPLHPSCRCKIESMKPIIPGNATKDEKNGADFWLAYFGKLPDYYISKDELFSLGWGNGKPPARFAPGKMLGGDIYYNKDGHLPTAPGRVWYEADINYYEGKRNDHRILYSNDGLLFVTYDHYKTFYEIKIGG